MENGGATPDLNVFPFPNNIDSQAAICHEFYMWKKQSLLVYSESKTNDDLHKGFGSGLLNEEIQQGGERTYSQLHDVLNDLLPYSHDHDISNERTHSTVVCYPKIKGGVKDHMVIQGVPSDPSSHDPLSESDVIATNSYFKASEDNLEESELQNPTKQLAGTRLSRWGLISVTHPVQTMIGNKISHDDSGIHPNLESFGGVKETRFNSESLIKRQESDNITRSYQTSTDIDSTRGLHSQYSEKRGDESSMNSHRRATADSILGKSLPKEEGNLPPIVDEFGRLVQKDVSDSESEGEKRPLKRRRSYSSNSRSRSRSRSRSSKGKSRGSIRRSRSRNKNRSRNRSRSRSRSRNRSSRKTRSRSRSRSGSRSRSRSRSKSRSRSRSSSEWQRRRSMSRSPRRKARWSRSNSRSPQRRRSFSRTPPRYMRSGEMGRGGWDWRGDRDYGRGRRGGRGDGQTPCFQFSRGKCSRGSACKFVHGSREPQGRGVWQQDSLFERHNPREESCRKEYWREQTGERCNRSGLGRENHIERFDPEDLGAGQGKYMTEIQTNSSNAHNEEGDRGYTTEGDFSNLVTKNKVSIEDVIPESLQGRIELFRARDISGEGSYVQIPKKFGSVQDMTVFPRTNAIDIVQKVSAYGESQEHVGSEERNIPDKVNAREVLFGGETEVMKNRADTEKRQKSLKAVDMEVIDVSTNAEVVTKVAEEHRESKASTTGSNKQSFLENDVAAIDVDENLKASDVQGQLQGNTLKTDMQSNSDAGIVTYGMNKEGLPRAMTLPERQKEANESDEKGLVNLDSQQLQAKNDDQPLSLVSLPQFKPHLPNFRTEVATSPMQAFPPQSTQVHASMNQPSVPGMGQHPIGNLPHPIPSNSSYRLPAYNANSNTQSLPFGDKVFNSENGGLSSTSQWGHQAFHSWPPMQNHGHAFVQSQWPVLSSGPPFHGQSLQGDPFSQHQGSNAGAPQMAEQSSASNHLGPLFPHPGSNLGATSSQHAIPSYGSLPGASFPGNQNPIPAQQSGLLNMGSNLPFQQPQFPPQQGFASQRPQQSPIPHPFEGDHSFTSQSLLPFTSVHTNQSLAPNVVKSSLNLNASFASSAPMVAQNSNAPWPFPMPSNYLAPQFPPTSYSYPLTMIPPLSGLVKVPESTNVQTLTDQYDPLSDVLDSHLNGAMKSTDSVIPSVFPTDTHPISSENVGFTVHSNNQAEVNASDQEVHDVDVGALDNLSPENWSPVKARSEQPQEQSLSKKGSRGLKMLRAAVADHVKDVLKPTWREGYMSKEAFKTIAKKAVEKVIGNLPSHHIPKSQEKVDQFMKSSRPKISKLVQGYVDKYLKL